jgi:S-adenosylmethionine:tRNA ribosyltransferase-isomerase
LKTTAAARPSFNLPEDRGASEPPEARGIERDQVRLLVARPEETHHEVFRNLATFLEPGDLLVVNTSATIPAAVDGKRDDQQIVVHFSTRLDDGSWTIELRSADGSEPLLDGAAGEVIALSGGARLEVLSAYAGVEGRSRMLTARLNEGTIEDVLVRAGRPISYSYVSQRWPLSRYQTVFAREPGSAEMPSAGRPFTTELVTELVTRGIAFAPLVLHTGVSSLERDEMPLPERFHVPAMTARFVNGARSAGRRVVAVGTTVARALESSTTPGGFVKPMDGWTDLVLSPDRPAQVVGGLITGFHSPESSHQLLLEAVVGAELTENTYISALEKEYLWHEFGDVCLLLPSDDMVLQAHSVSV